MALLVLASCGPATPFTPCHLPLDDWCFHEESEDGPRKPTPDSTCEPVTFVAGPETYGCGGRWNVDLWSGGFTSESRLFDAATGELVGVRYTTDVNTYCGGFEFLYGRRIDCAPTCAWTEEDAARVQLPLCEG